MTTLPTMLVSDATFSPCERYRYLLRRIWNHDVPPCYWVMLNPSTADHTVNDPTVRRCIGFSHAWGHGGCIVLNAFALRSTCPKALTKVEDPVGPDNDRHLREIPFGSKIVVAWGEHGRLFGREERVLEILSGRVRCLGYTKAGSPRHPLYVKSSTELVPFPRREA